MSINYDICNSYFMIAVFHVQCDLLTGKSVWTIYQIKNLFSKVAITVENSHAFRKYNVSQMDVGDTKGI